MPRVWRENEAWAARYQRCLISSGRTSTLVLILNGLIGEGLFAEPGFQEILGQLTQSSGIALSVNVAPEAFHFK